MEVKDLRIEQNHITFLFGESGIGKSLLAKAVYGLLSPEEFAVTINGMAYDRYLAENTTREVQKSSFFVFQEPLLHLNPLLTIDSQLKEGILSKGFGKSTVLQRLWDTADRQSIKNILEIYPKPYRPSGGEKQRFLLSMAFLKIEMFMKLYRNRQKHFLCLMNRAEVWIIISAIYS